MTSGPLGVPDAVVAALPRLRIIAINGVGYDRVNLEAARARGIRVTNTPDVLTDDVADLAVGLIIAVLRRLPQAHEHVRSGQWPARGLPLATRVSGKRFGIMGLGRIGLALARRLTAFDGVIGYTGALAEGRTLYLPPRYAVAGAGVRRDDRVRRRFAVHPAGGGRRGPGRARTAGRADQHRPRRHRRRGGAGVRPAGGPARRRRARRVRERAARAAGAVSRSTRWC